MRDRVKFLTPVVKNHSVSADILAATANDTNTVRDMVDLELRRRPITVRGTEINGSIETSPARRRAFFEQRDLLRAFKMGYMFEECARNVEFWDSSGCVRLGWCDRKDEEWR